MKPFEQGRFEDLPELPRRPHPFFAAPSERVTIDSSHFGRVSLAFRRYGRGRPLVCVHGLMTSSYSFRYLLGALGARFELLIPDLPGAGRSDAPDVPYTPDALADLIGDFIDAVGAVGAPVLGNSMGGYLSMVLALRRPSVMQRLVNLHSPGLPTPRNWALEAALSAPGSAKLLDLLVRADPLRWVHRNVHYYDESLKSLEEAREYGTPLGTPEGRRAFHRYLADTLRASEMRAFERRLAALGGRFPVPLQLVYARRDPMVPPSVGRGLARLLPTAKVVWLERASHFAHVDAPDDFLSVALPFLEGSAVPR